MSATSIFFNPATAVFVVVPFIMLISKAGRLGAKERHTLDMRLHHYADFWRKGNDFVDGISANVCRDIQEFALEQQVAAGNKEAAAAAAALSQPMRRQELRFQQPGDVRSGRSPFVRGG